MPDAIQIEGLTKHFKRARALSGVDLTVPEGSIYGFLGPNGAGKTTTIRILTGLARPTSGEARVFGHDVMSQGSRVRNLVGFLPDVPGYYPWMTAEQYLRLAGRLYGVTGNVLEQRIESLLALSGLEGVDNKVGGFSRGMKQRLGVAQALISAPRLLILDEPTSALDPIGRKELLDMVTALRGKTTVFFSTHILGDVERVCDTVAILDRGRVVKESSIIDLKREHAGSRIVVELARGAEVLEPTLLRQEWVSTCDRDSQTLRCAVTDIAEARYRLPKLVAMNDLSLIKMDDEEPTLEDVFVGLVGGAA